MLLTNRGEAIVKLEGTAFTGEVLADGDHVIRFSSPPEYSANIAEYQRDILDGTLDQWTSVMGKQTGQITLKVDVAPGATITTEPAYSRLLTMCGMKVTGWSADAEVAVGSAVHGISWRPHADFTHQPGTIEVQEILEGSSADMLVTRLVGAMCNLQIMIGTVGEPLQFIFTISGSLNLISDRAFASKLDSTLGTIVPPPVMGISALQALGDEQDLDSFEINLNNELGEWPDPTKTGGVKGFYVSKKRPTLVMDPTMKLQATENWYADWTDETTGLLSINMGISPSIGITAPALQLVSNEFGDRNGARLLNKTFLFTSAEGANPNSVVEILQGTKS